MLDSIITSKTRIKLLLKFFLNSKNKSYLRHLANEFGESSNAVRVELNRLEGAGLLISEFRGNRKYFRANTSHPMFSDINSILRKFVGIDQITERIISKIGDLEAAFITGDFAKGHDSKVIDLVLIGENLDMQYVGVLVEKAESIIGRKIRYSVSTSDQMENIFEDQGGLLIWTADDGL